MSLSPQRQQQLTQMLDELKARGAPVSVAEDAANQFSAKYDNEQPGILQSIGKGAESFGTGLLTGLGKFADDNKGLWSLTARLSNFASFLASARDFNTAS